MAVTRRPAERQLERYWRACRRRGDAAVLLQGVEEALNEIALAVEGEVGLSRVLAVGFRRNDGRDPALLSFSTSASESFPLSPMKASGSTRREAPHSSKEQEKEGFSIPAQLD
jgi:hypothetical protein